MKPIAHSIAASLSPSSMKLAKKKLHLQNKQNTIQVHTDHENYSLKSVKTIESINTFDTIESQNDTFNGMIGGSFHEKKRVEPTFQKDTIGSIHIDALDDGNQMEEDLEDCSDVSTLQKFNKYSHYLPNGHDENQFISIDNSQKNENSMIGHENTIITFNNSFYQENDMKEHQLEMDLVSSQKIIGSQQIDDYDLLIQSQKEHGKDENNQVNKKDKFYNFTIALENEMSEDDCEGEGELAEYKSFSLLEKDNEKEIQVNKTIDLNINNNTTIVQLQSNSHYLNVNTKLHDDNENKLMEDDNEPTILIDKQIHQHSELSNINNNLEDEDLENSYMVIDVPHKQYNPVYIEDDEEYNDNLLKTNQEEIHNLMNKMNLQNDMSTSQISSGNEINSNQTNSLNTSIHSETSLLHSKQSNHSNSQSANVTTLSNATNQQTDIVNSMSVHQQAYQLDFPSSFNSLYTCRNCNKTITYTKSNVEQHVDMIELYDFGLNDPNNHTHTYRPVVRQSQENDNDNISSKIAALEINAENEFLGNFYEVNEIYFQDNPNVIYKRTITSSMRAKVLETLFKETSYLTRFLIDQVALIIDHYLFYHPIFSPDHLQKLVYCCYILLFKMDTRNENIDCEERMMLTSEDIHEYEIEIWKSLNFKTHFTSVYDLFDEYSRFLALQISAKNHREIIQPYLFAITISAHFLNYKNYCLAVCVLYYYSRHPDAKQEDQKFVDEFIDYLCGNYSISTDWVIQTSNEIRLFLNHLIQTGVYPSYVTASTY